MTTILLILLTLYFMLFVCNGLNNGLARTPPMGWLSWERFRCNVDCVNDPDNCISEKLFMTMADILASDGYKDAGYQYVDIDDCWLAKTRDVNGKLQPDPQRFPSGIKALADYIHKRGFKIGIYESFGLETCEGYPGSEYYLQMDTETFAGWGIDLLKFDGCDTSPNQYLHEYPPMPYWLARTGRPILYSHAFPKLERQVGIKTNYTRVSLGCNIARNYEDIQDSWESLADIIKYYGDNQDQFAAFAGPGYFNDPDELIIGNFGLSYVQERVQMGIWAIMAAPLLMSVDLRNIRPESKALLLHKRLISINQDSMGIQGKRVLKIGNFDVWTRPILPKGSFAFAMVNFGNRGTPKKITVKCKDFGLINEKGYNLTEVFDGKYMGVLKPTSMFTTQVNPTGIFMAVANPLN